MKNQIVSNKKFPTLVLVKSVQPLDGYRVHITFTNGVERDVDLEPVIWGPVFEEIRNDPNYFRQVYVDPISQTLTWPNEVDLDPESLYYGDEEPPWWTEYKERQKKKRARQLRERKARKPVNSHRKPKAKVTKKRAVKSNTRKMVRAKSK
ncbi:MAG TPA: DUF2442 domain-containing protein [Anaerolineae bacterium]|nr:DUF2442 domain-containing protein [Anaerolineae bacterium]